jgi:hypothetical protein
VTCNRPLPSQPKPGRQTHLAGASSTVFWLFSKRIRRVISCENPRTSSRPQTEQRLCRPSRVTRAPRRPSGGLPDVPRRSARRTSRSSRARKSGARPRRSPRRRGRPHGVVRRSSDAGHAARGSRARDPRPRPAPRQTACTRPSTARLTPVSSKMRIMRPSVAERSMLSCARFALAVRSRTRPAAELGRVATRSLSRQHHARRPQTRKEGVSVGSGSH